MRKKQDMHQGKKKNRELRPVYTRSQHCYRVEQTCLVPAKQGVQIHLNFYIPIATTV